MRDLLTIELVLAVLMVSSFTCVGLVALWAANSPRHWFLRVALVVGLFAPFLLVSADELFLAPVLAIGVVCFATFMRHVYGRRTESTSTIKAIA